MFERPGRAVVEVGMKVKAFNPYRKFNRTRHSLGELVAAVGAATVGPLPSASPPPPSSTKYLLTSSRSA